MACTASRERAPRSGGAWTAEDAQRQAYRALFPEFLAAMPLERDTEVLMPVAGVSLSQVSDTWGAARSEGRRHEGTDIFAPTGTPVYSATPGYVYRIDTNPYGGKVVTVVGGAGVRYYYAHLSAFTEGLEKGQVVTPKTLRQHRQCEHYPATPASGRLQRRLRDVWLGGGKSLSAAHGPLARGRAHRLLSGPGSETALSTCTHGTSRTRPHRTRTKAT